MMAFITQLRELSRRQARRLQDLHRRAARVHGRSSRRCSRPASTPTSSSSTAARAAPARRRRSSRTRWASRCWRASSFVHNTLVGAGIRDQIKVGASGKMVTGVGDRDRAGARRGLVQLRARVHVLRRLHPGAALQHEPCPVGVTTQNPKLQRALVVPDKAERVHSFHKNTVHALAEFVAAMGLDHPSELRAASRRPARQRDAGREPRRDLPVPEAGSLLDGTAPERMQRYWNESTRRRRSTSTRTRPDRRTEPRDRDRPRRDPGASHDDGDQERRRDRSRDLHAAGRQEELGVLQRVPPEDLRAPRGVGPAADRRPDGRRRDPGRARRRRSTTSPSWP